MGQRWIEIDLSRQRLIAWEGNTAVYAVVISSGKSSTPTRTGTFAVETKHRVTRMTRQGSTSPTFPIQCIRRHGNSRRLLAQFVWQSRYSRLHKCSCQSC